MLTDNSTAYTEAVESTGTLRTKGNNVAKEINMQK